MTKIYFIRHGQYEGFDKVVAFRPNGSHLDAVGKNQAQNLANFFADKNITKLFTSPAERCEETAEVIGTKLGLVPVKDDRIVEVVSPFAGMDKEKYFEIKGDKSLFELPEQIAKGETIGQVEDRMRSFLEEILEKYSDQNTVVVSHDDAILILKYFLNGDDFSKFRDNQGKDLDPGDFVELDFNGQQFITGSRHKNPSEVGRI